MPLLRAVNLTVCLVFVVVVVVFLWGFFVCFWGGSEAVFFAVLKLAV